MIALAGYNLLKYCLQRRLVLDETNAYCLVLLVSFHEEPPVIAKYPRFDEYYIRVSEGTKFNQPHQVMVFQ